MTPEGYIYFKFRVLIRKKNFRPREKMATKARQSEALRKKTFR